VHLHDSCAAVFITLPSTCQVGTTAALPAAKGLDGGAPDDEDEAMAMYGGGAGGDEEDEEEEMQAGQVQVRCPWGHSTCTNALLTVVDSTAA
jgi:hypothetical protein